METLNNILAIAKNIKITTSKADTYKAFWINAYNLAVLKGILDVYPTTSPLDTKGFFDKKKFNLGGLSLTLNDISFRIGLWCKRVSALDLKSLSSGRIGNAVATTNG